MKTCWVDLNKTDLTKLGYGCGMWAKCLEIPAFKYDSDEVKEFNPDIIICAIYGGTFHIPKHVKTNFPNAKVVCVFDYNSLEIHNVIGYCALEECFPFVDVWLAPSFTGKWISTVSGKPYVDVYRPYPVEDFNYVPYEDRGKAIIVSEHTKSRQTFSSRMVARRIMDELGEEYKIYIKRQCIPGLEGTHLENAEKESTIEYYGLSGEFVGSCINDLGVKPVLAIDHFPVTIFGGWHVINAFHGTPSIGLNTSQACCNAFPGLDCAPYDLEHMVEVGVAILKNKVMWDVVSNRARKYALEHWSFEACRKIWEDEVLSLC